MKKSSAVARHLFTWSLWPLVFLVYVGALISIAWLAPLSLGNWLPVMGLTVVVFLVGLEEILPYRSDWSVRGDREIWRDIGHTLLYANVGAIVTQLVFLAGATALMIRMGFADGLGVWPDESPFVVQVLLVIVLGDLLEYWTHRLTHSVSWLWSLHAIHHSPVRLSALKAGRHHVVYFLARGLVAWLPLVVLGASPQLILWQVAALSTTGFLSHANVAFRVPVFIQRAFVTPAYHRIHHSLDIKEGNSNFAVVLPIWDMIFGTHVDPVSTQPKAVGVHRDPIPRAFVSELLSPFTFRRLVRRARQASR
jgi:sterol desaturase/sphingolipid hydroxylase (fatty acid hydroxylase superfamily)